MHVTTQEFLEFIADIMRITKDQISLNTEYGSIGKWDSLMHLRLVAEIEEKYRVSIPIDEVPTIKSLDDFYRYL